MQCRFLKKYDSNVLDEYQPISIGADGNCLYRAMSLLMYGSESMHTHLRTLGAIEMLKNSRYYDDTTKHYSDPFSDWRIVNPGISELLSSACRYGSYSGIYHAHAVANSLGLSLVSYMPSVGPQDM